MGVSFGDLYLEGHIVRMLGASSFSSLSLIFSLSLGVKGWEEASPGQFPFTASLQIKDLGGHNCGAAILSPWWVIATANCADTDDSLDHNNFVVVAGEFDLATDEATEQTIHVDKVFRHPYYSSDLGCDIALVRTPPIGGY